MRHNFDFHVRMRDAIHYGRPRKRKMLRMLQIYRVMDVAAHGDEAGGMGRRFNVHGQSSLGKHGDGGSAIDPRSADNIQVETLK